MKKLQVFDPALCCSSGVCGTDVDQKLVDFSADVDWAKQQGGQIERFNLAQQPVAFAEAAPVHGLLTRSGESALPITLLDGDLRRAGIEPWAWVINNSVAAAKVSSPLLKARAQNELREIEAVARRHANRYALVPLLQEEPVGVQRLQQLSQQGV